MLKIATILWIIIGTTLAGIALTAVVSVPSMVDQSMKLIPWAVFAGFVAAIPVSWLVAAKIGNPK